MGESRRHRRMMAGTLRPVGAVDTMDTFFELLNAGDREAAVGLMADNAEMRIHVGALTVRATHTQHRARRILGTEKAALGYLVSTPARLYFAGDTQVFEGMRELAPGLEVAMLPIWGWGPRVGPGHLDPRGAADALRLLAPRLAIPIHWGTYRRMGLSRDPATLREPAERFERLAAELAPDVTVRILSPGERLQLPLEAGSTAGVAGE